MIRRYSRPRHLMPGWTSRPLPSRTHGLERLDDHALAAAPGHLQPPVDAGPHRRLVARCRRRAAGWSGAGRVGVVLDEPVEPGQLLVVRHGGEAAALDGEDLERREPHAVQAVGRPAVAPVRLGERGRVRGPLALPAPAARRRRRRGPPPPPGRRARPGRPRRTRRRRPRTGVRSSPAPSATTASARRPAAASRCPAPPTARPRSTAVAQPAEDLLGDGPRRRRTGRPVRV